MARHDAFLPHGDFVIGAPTSRTWPSHVDALCLHCAEPCVKALPAVRFHDPQENIYVVYGFFCRPGCALANASESRGDTARRLLWTQTMLRQYFGVSPLAKASAPRASLQKFGGPLCLAEFYGEDEHNTAFLELLEPPFVTSAVYTRVERDGRAGAVAHDSKVRRPLTRSEPLAQPTDTGEEPMVLEFLARLDLSDDEAEAKEAEAKGEAETDDGEDTSEGEAARPKRARRDANLKKAKAVAPVERKTRASAGGGGAEPVPIAKRAAVSTVNGSLSAYLVKRK